MYVRGIRGATTVDHNDTDEIWNATRQLFEQMIIKNEIQPHQVAYVWLTMTKDLNAAFPAQAIRHLSGWNFVPLMCAAEISVEGSLARCIRLMVSINTTKEQHEIYHVYLNAAVDLRPEFGIDENV